MYTDIDINSNLSSRAYTLFTGSKNYLDRNPEYVPVYTGHLLFNTTQRVILLFIVQSN